jgi:DNA-directed RNA polymerase specialized sigma24 family protein
MFSETGLVREPMSFTEMMSLLRQGNQEAATRLVRLVEPKIQQAVRKLLVSLSSQFDPQDISQVVLAKFFFRGLAWRCDMDHPEQLVRLLVRIAKNKVRDELRKVRARQRVCRRMQDVDAAGDMLNAAATREASPSKIVAGQELVEEIYVRLSAEESHLARQRSQGMDWPAIALHAGRTPESLRKKLARAIHRVRRELDL